ncbi:MAG TPA: hypothetical protein VMI31_04470, partial [Fimbriimonadaceae bacterium]|nr:hypothetical protein [Fimbriimonadaceae bacterium]
VCVVDNGLFVELAITLIPSFGRVFYFNEWMSAFPKSNSTLVGQGVPGLTKVRSPFEIVDDVDLWVFPDVYYGPLQKHLVDLGKRVWGGRMGENLELDRAWSKRTCADAGIDIGPFKVITGLDALREFLRENDDVFVKVSFTRGDFETFHARNYRNIEPKLDELEWSLGAKKRVIEFVVEAAINDAVEVGYDGFCIDGKFASGAAFGLEVKDRGYLGEALKYEDLPECVKSVNKKLAPIMRAFNYRGFFSSEIRATPDGKAYLIDPCARFGSPPGELFEAFVANWSDILWEGAEGVVVEPKYVGRFGAELLLHSTWADKNWQEVEFPKGLREFVKLRNLTVIDGRYYVAPQQVGLPEIGAVVATSDTMEGAIRLVQERAEKVKGYYVDTYPDSLNEAVEAYEAVKTLRKGE